MRKLATIRKISEIKPIENADAIEIAVVDGWQCVIKKGEFSVGDLVVYLEVDSWVPTELAPFLSKGKEPKEFNGVKGERLRSIKLRGTLSQGLILPLSILGDRHEIFTIGENCIGADVTEQLGIQKWEMPIPAQLAGQVRGNFPSEIPKTDQERIQNLTKEFDSKISKNVFQVTEKLHGSSCTFYLDVNGDFHVCSRNLDLKYSEDNAYWKMANILGIEQKMKDRSLFGIAIQGELIGEGINGNQYQTKLDFYVFDAYSTAFGSYLNPSATHALVMSLGINHVPIVSSHCIINPDETINSLLEFAEGKSKLNGSEREGLVFKSYSEDGFSFKAVSNKWLLKTGE